MQLSNRVTLAKSSRHNADYVACSAFPGNGILGENRGQNCWSPSARRAAPTCCACFGRIESKCALDDSIRTLRTAERFQPQALGRTAGRSRAGRLTAPDRDRSAWTHPHEPSAGTQARQLPERSSTPSQILAHRGTCHHRVSTVNLRWRQSPRRRVAQAWPRSRTTLHDLFGTRARNLCGGAFGFQHSSGNRRKNRPLL
jgi:hypothetical protein